MNRKVNIRRWFLPAVALLAAGSLVVGLLVAGTLYARGFWDSSKAVHIKSGEIETSTLAIGTHLIHLSALTDAIYTIASDSAGESGQNRIYYKSELGEGAWFDITTATSLADITTAGTPVTDETIEALFFTHHTKSDKITYDLRTGQAVNIFDIQDPYDLENLEELSPLKMQYDQIRELSGENDETKRIDQIWSTPVKGDEAPEAIRKQEDSLAALQRYLNVLTANEADANEIDKVSYVMEMVDAARRYEIFTVVEPVLEEYLDELGAAGTKDVLTNLDGDTEEVSAVSPELVSAAAESLGNVQSALITHEGKMLSEGPTVISSAEYGFCLELISHAEADDHASCDADVQNLLHLDNIQNDIISDRPQELAMLEDQLIPAGTSEYLSALGQGESAEYRAEVAKNSAQAVLNGLIKTNEGEVSTRQRELEFLITAECNRLGSQAALDFIDERLQLTTETFSTGIPDDAFADGARSSVNAHIEFLTQLRRQTELALGGNQMDKLTAQKEDLQTELMQALDNNDLAGAKELEQQISAVEESIRAIEAETSAQIAQMLDQISGMEEGSAERAAAEAELAALESSMSDGTMGSVIAGLKQDALSAIAGGSDGSEEDASAAVEALAGMLDTAPQLALPALQEVYNELLLGGGDQDLIDTIEQAILENPNALRSELTTEQIREETRLWLLEVNGRTDQDKTPLSGVGGISRQSAYNTVAAVLALQMYYEETGSTAAQQALAALVQEQVNFGNTLFFTALTDGTGEYVPLASIQALTGRRYVWEKNASLGVLAYGADYYGFTVYSTEVTRDRDGEKTETMARPAQYRSGVYIPEEYSYEQFGVSAMYLSGVSYGCVYDDPAMELGQELFDRLLALE